MSSQDKPPFDGNIRTTVKESTPWWPLEATAPDGAPNILIVLFDDVGFSDFGCYGSPIKTPAIDRLAALGLRYTGFHTTAMCSTTRAALLTGRNHHSVGVGCLANFDGGFPGTPAVGCTAVPVHLNRSLPPGRTTIACDRDP